jgi:hypothetical protein
VRHALNNFAVKILAYAAVFCQSYAEYFLMVGGLLTGLALIGAINSDKHRAVFVRIMLASTVIGLMPFLLFNHYIHGYFKGLEPFGNGLLLKYLAGALLGIAIGIGWRRTITPWLAEKSSKLRRGTALERNKKTDVRRIADFLPEPVGDFTPFNYWDGPSGFFLGLDEFKKPIYWAHQLPHIQVAGTTGSGKGVFLSMLAAQCAWRGEPVFFIDPKDDEWAPHVLAQVCEHLKLPFHLIDLRPGAGHQLNLFDKASQEQIEELFLAGFSLSEKGSDSDFYTIADRQAANEMAYELAQQPQTPATVYATHGAALQERAAKFAGMLQEMAQIPAVNAKPDEGLNLSEFINKPGVVYVLGSMRNAKVIRLQRMLLIKIVQLAEARDRTKQQSKLAVVLDEAKYHISRPALEALGAARDKGLHVVLAHQSLDDLRDCPADLSADAVVGAVMENCALKLVYRVQDPKTAEWFARKSGRIEVDDEMRKISRNAALAETVEGDRMIRQAERFLIDENMLLNLHSAQGVLFGHGLPKFIHTAPIRVNKLSPEQLAPKVVSGDRLPTATEMLAIQDKPQSQTKEDPFAPFAR